MKRFVGPVMMLCLFFVVGWTELVDNFLGLELKPATPTNGQLWKFVTASGKYELSADSGGPETLSISDLTDVDPMTEASGDLLFFSTAWTRLAKGSDGQVLKLASGLPSWAADSGGPETLSISDLTDVGAMTEARGGLLVVNSILEWTQLPIGGANTVLHGSATDPSYSAIVSADVTDGTLVSADLSAAAGITSAQIFDTTIVVGDLAAALSTRLPPTPATNGGVVIDTGAAYTITAQGAANTLLHGVGAGTPTFSKLVEADVTALTLTVASLAAAVTNRLMVAPATVGRISVDGGTGAAAVALAQGTSGQIFQSAGAAANPAFSTMSGDATIASGGALTIANAAVTLAKQANLAASTLIGRDSSAIGVPQALTMQSGVAITSGVFTPFPPGIIMAYGAATAPTGWLTCGGQAVSRTGANAALFAIVGTTYGVGDGSTTFNVPDLRGRTIAGLDNPEAIGTISRLTSGGSGITGTTLGAAGGVQTHPLVTAELAAHTHGLSTDIVRNTGSANVASGANIAHNISSAATESTGSGTAHQNTQPTIVLVYIIKQ